MPIYFRRADRSTPLCVESIGNRWEQWAVERPDGYPLYHWLQTEQGEGEVQVSEQTLLLREGEGVLLAPFVPHTYRGKSPLWRTCFVTFGGRLAQDMDKLTNHRPFCTAANSPEFSFSAWVERMVAQPDTDSTALAAACFVFFLHATRLQQPFEQPQHPLYRQYVQPVIREMETRYADALTAQNLAGQVFVSPQYLNRLFRRFCGCPVYQYLLDLRLNRAKELLVKRPGLEIQQVGSMVGFHDTSHFIALFKKSTGYTPLAFRRLYC